MAIYANENGTIKELTSKIDFGNGFVINGIEYIGEYLPAQRNGTFTLPKPYTSYKYLVVYDFYGKKNNVEGTWINQQQHSCLDFIDTSLINPNTQHTYDDIWLEDRVRLQLINYAVLLNSLILLH